MEVDEYHGADAGDLEAIQNFAAFLTDPTSRCPICLAADHRRYSQCPEVDDESRRRIGVMAMDVSYAKTIERMSRRRRVPVNVPVNGEFL